MEDASAESPRVLVTTSTFPRWEGDSEPAFVFELSRRLADRFDITVLAPRSPGSRKQENLAGLNVLRFAYFFNKWEDLANHGGGMLNRIRARRMNFFLVPFFLAGQLLALIRLLNKEDFDLIHAHWIVPQGLMVIIARFLSGRKVSVVCTSHGGDLFALQGMCFKKLKQRVIQSCDVLAVVSSAMKQTVVDMGISDQRVKVMPMGVDLKNLFIPDPAVKRSSNEILFVGRLVEKKGLHVLVEAMPEILAKFPEVRLTVAGAGPMEKRIKKRVADLGLAGKVRFLGMVPQKKLPLLYSRAAMAVFPFVIAEDGDQEGLGLVVVEAMGCGCPVIASDLPALRDTVLHGRTGFLVDPGAPSLLAEGFIRAIENPEKINSLVSNARDHVLAKFDWSAAAKRYANLFLKQYNEIPLLYCVKDKASS